MGTFLIRQQGLLCHWGQVGGSGELHSGYGEQVKRRAEG